ncbi:unnamed protein product [Protopolystoma xenopodis]|uniref:Galactosyltransferase N-terminal domain-containing protein n=1 Tax=Protopolystoma xenopodis TaxID=117903 RepID=A0A448WMI3_9PLAT|nr:unnamed protein product [Protopolystoma xenopodis]
MLRAACMREHVPNHRPARETRGLGNVQLPWKLLASPAENRAPTGYARRSRANFARQQQSRKSPCEADNFVSFVRMLVDRLCLIASFPPFSAPRCCPAYSHPTTNQVMASRSGLGYSSDALAECRRTCQLGFSSSAQATSRPQRVLVAVPYRNRSRHLPVFLTSIQSALRHQKICYLIVISEQVRHSLSSPLSVTHSLSLSLYLFLIASIRQWTRYIVTRFVGIVVGIISDCCHSLHQATNSSGSIYQLFTLSSNSRPAIHPGPLSFGRLIRLGPPIRISLLVA